MLACWRLQSSQAKGPAPPAGVGGGCWLGGGGGSGARAKFPYNELCQTPLPPCQPPSYPYSRCLYQLKQTPLELFYSSIDTITKTDDSRPMYQVTGSASIKIPKMTVRGTMVRSEVCNSWCFCLES